MGNKKGKLFLYYDDSIELTHADNISFKDKMYLEEQMKGLFFKDFDKLGLLLSRARFLFGLCCEVSDFIGHDI